MRRQLNRNNSGRLRNLPLAPARGDTSRLIKAHDIDLIGLIAAEDMIASIILTDIKADMSPALAAELDALINRQTVAGPRYGPAMQASIDTEDFD